ncbi:tetratricopeptide repeat protein [delta proteobacterium NaphS2]|nr:tetratricopeptide repeat protein [delta proteobacterium NaphS2]
MLESTWQWFADGGSQQILLTAIVFLLVGLFLGKRMRPPAEDKHAEAANRGDSSFFKGVQYLLSNDHDQAIEEFTKSVQVNSDTIETYVTLGNLYRSRGDIDRAIRIRQNIILRPNIDEQIKIDALFDLGKDYLKGGFLNRALKTFLQVSQKSPDDVRTLKEIESIYEGLKDWEKAFATRQKIAMLENGSHEHILAHHLVEAGKVCQEKDDVGKARTLFNKAISTQKTCVDAYLHLGDLHFRKQEYKKAIAVWKRVAEIAPQFTFLAYGRLEGAYNEMKNLEPVEDFLKECARLNPDAFTHTALARYLYNKNDMEGALREINNALSLDPGFWEARRFRGQLFLKSGAEDDMLKDYSEIIEGLNIPYLRFRCIQCGFEPNELLWQCPQCNQWDTIGLINDKEAPVDSIH